jgi:hypothetical protein
MKKRLLAVATILLLGLPAAPSLADSPITSTPFADAYQDSEIISKAKQTGVLDLEMAQYLSSRSIPIDIKAAIINALSWKVEGKQNATLYRYFLGLTYGKTIEQLNPKELTSDEVFALGYLTVMDDYFRPEKAVPLLLEAKSRKPSSFTVAMITVLAQTQVVLSSEWCQIWRLTDAVASDRTLKQDMRPEAREIILAYMRQYQAFCNPLRSAN